MRTIALLTPDDSEIEAFQHMGQQLNIAIEPIKTINEFFDRRYAGLWYYSYPLDTKVLDQLDDLPIKGIIVFLDRKERSQRNMNSRFMYETSKPGDFLRWRVYPVDVDEFSEYLSRINFWSDQ